MDRHGSSADETTSYRVIAAVHATYGLTFIKDSYTGVSGLTIHFDPPD
jgi:hypothetical protein